MDVLEKKFIGTVLDQCLGDALGFPVEGKGTDSCSNYIKNKVELWFKGAIPSQQEWLGQYTDDSQLARELLISLVECNGFIPEDYAYKIAILFGEDKIVGRGLATNTAAYRLIAGTDWTESGVAPPSAGNGAAMRAAPIGLFYCDSIDLLIKHAHEQGFITHHDPRCSAGSVAIAGAVALALQAESINVSNFTNSLSAWVQHYHEEFADNIKFLEQWILLDPLQALEKIKDLGKTDSHANFWPGISPFVIPSVIWSLYCFLKYPDSYYDAITTSIAVGGDVDTTAAMTGAISGAYLGVDALPLNLTKLLNDQGEWNCDDLIKLGRKCYALKCKC